MKKLILTITAITCLWLSSFAQSYSISGYFTYDNSWNTPLDSVWVHLMLNGFRVDSARTDTIGYYQFTNIPDGIYNISAMTNKPWCGVNSTDAVKTKYHFQGSQLLTSSINIHAADVNLSYAVNPTDAVKIIRRFIGMDNTFARGDWLFEKPFGGNTINVSTYLNDTVIVNGGNVSQNFKGLCVGDVNHSYVPFPGAKFSPKVSMDYVEKQKTTNNELFEIPITVTEDVNIGAISLILNFPQDLVSVNSVQLNGNDDVYWNVIGNELRIGWFETKGALILKNGETLLNIRLKTTENFKPGDIIKFSIANDPLCEIADENGEPINNVVLNTSLIEPYNNLDFESSGSATINDLFIYPNPAQDKLSIHYNTEENDILKIEFYSILGEKIFDVVNIQATRGTNNSVVDLSSIPSGLYSCKIILNNNMVFVNKVVVSK